MKKERLWIMRIVLTVMTVAVIAFIFGRSTLSADGSTEESDFMLGWLNGILSRFGLGEIDDYFVRKLAHFAEFFVLGALLCATAYSYLLRRGKMLLAALSAGLAVAVADELIQLGSEGRACEVRDMLLDYCAVLTAALCAMLILYLVGSRKSKRSKKEGTKSE